MNITESERTGDGGNTIETLAPGGLVVEGKLVKIARLRDEWYEEVQNPARLIDALRQNPMGANLFTFIQRLPDTEPTEPYHMEWDNVASIHVRSFDYWWKELLPKSTRKHIRRSIRAGVTTQPIELDDNLVKQIWEIYNETPIRQGRPFSHYGDTLDTVRKAHGTFPGRRDFIGAFFEGELIGFLSLIYAGQTARSVQVITKVKHQNKWATNALLAEAVRVCEKKGVPYLVYGRFDFGKSWFQGITAFKSENGFTKAPMPRYYIPLNLTGRIALRLKLHHDLGQLLPEALVSPLVNIRRKWHGAKRDAS